MISELQITKGGANHEPTERVSPPFPNSFFVPSLSFLPPPPLLLLLSSFFSSSPFFFSFDSFNKFTPPLLSPLYIFFSPAVFLSKPSLSFPFFSFRAGPRVDSSATFTRNYNNSNDNKSWNATRRSKWVHGVCTSLDGNDGKTASHGVGREKEGTHLPPGSHRNSSSPLVRLPPFRVSSFSRRGCEYCTPVVEASGIDRLCDRIERWKEWTRLPRPSCTGKEKKRRKKERKKNLYCDINRTRPLAAVINS